MNSTDFLLTDNGSAFDFDKIPCLEMGVFRKAVSDALKAAPAVRVLSFFAIPESNENFRLVCVLADAEAHKIAVTSTETGGHYQALTPEIPQFHWFERELAEQSGIVPDGHPWLKPIRFKNHESTPGVTDYFKLEGEEAHEVAVGPIHAGVIEPGHFRFQCMGERVYHLEIELGYQHRGMEALMTGPVTPQTLALAGTIAGDTAIGHTLTFCHALEGLCGIPVDKGSLRLRAAALELERLANHIGDLGALAGDVAYLPTSSFCGRIRGEYLNMTAELCGNRFGRNLVVPGGCACTLDKERISRILAKLKKTWKELQHALNLMFDSPTVLDRLENTGTVTKENLVRIGAVGPAARAGGVQADARQDLPLAEYENCPPAPAFKVSSGDVMARARVRYDEIIASHDWLFKVLPEAVSEKVSTGKITNLPENKMVVSVTEGWRGEICHVLLTGKDNTLRKVKITDPSFHNWFALALALRNGEISDFPICNKSFNLSYCGHDL